jgi:hypothetical protein
VVALQNNAFDATKDIVCIQTCKPAVPPAEIGCPVCEQTSEATELLFGSSLFSFLMALDNRSREQHRSYTNKMNGRGRIRYCHRLAEIGRIAANLPLDSLMPACGLVHGD